MLSISVFFSPSAGLVLLMVSSTSLRPSERDPSLRRATAVSFAPPPRAAWQLLMDGRCIRTKQLVWFRCCIEWDIHKLISYGLWYWYWLVSRIQRPLTATLRGFLRVEMREHKKITMSSVQGQIWFEVRYLSQRKCWDAAPRVKSNQISREFIIQCCADN